MSLLRDHDVNVHDVTIRQKLLDAIAAMTGENGITPQDLKKSESTREGLAAEVAELKAHVQRYVNEV